MLIAAPHHQPNEKEHALAELEHRDGFVPERTAFVGEQLSDEYRAIKERREALEVAHRARSGPSC